MDVGVSVIDILTVQAGDVIMSPQQKSLGICHHLVVSLELSKSAFSCPSHPLVVKVKVTLLLSK